MACLCCSQAYLELPASFSILTILSACFLYHTLFTILFFTILSTIFFLPYSTCCVTHLPTSNYHQHPTLHFYHAFKHTFFIILHHTTTLYHTHLQCLRSTQAYPEQLPASSTILLPYIEYIQPCFHPTILFMIII